MSLVSSPTLTHTCPVTSVGMWYEWRKTDDPLQILMGSTRYAAFIHERDPAGTVRACPECGQTWISTGTRPGWMSTVWRREGRFERWRRERRARKP